MKYNIYTSNNQELDAVKEVGLGLFIQVKAILDTDPRAQIVDVYLDDDNLFTMSRNREEK